MNEAKRPVGWYFEGGMIREGFWPEPWMELQEVIRDRRNPKSWSPEGEPCLACLRANKKASGVCWWPTGDKRWKGQGSQSLGSIGSCRPYQKFYFILGDVECLWRTLIRVEAWPHLPFKRITLSSMWRTDFAGQPDWKEERKRGSHWRSTGEAWWWPGLKCWWWGWDKVVG